MGLVRKAITDSVVPGEGGNADIGTMIRQAVTDEIERQRLNKLKAEDTAEPDVSAEGH